MVSSGTNYRTSYRYRDGLYTVFPNCRQELPLKNQRAAGILKIERGASPGAQLVCERNGDVTILNHIDDRKALANGY